MSQSEETGIIEVDEKKCNGCGWCIQACDYGAIRLPPEVTSVMICDLCGGETKCVEWFPEGVLELKFANECDNMFRFVIVEKMVK